jgi:hypothetical protein
MGLIGSLLDALSLAFGMFWEILWALVLGFALSAAVQAVVSKAEMTRLLPDDSARSLGIACGLGAASSSCSYAAVALARSIVRKGADFTAAMVFEFASTNLVVELGIIMAILLGWQFTLGEFVGGPIMIVLLALMFRTFLSQRLLNEARRQADRGLRGSMEGHAEMDMAVTEGPFFKRLTSPAGFTAISHYFVMDWHGKHPSRAYSSQKRWVLTGLRFISISRKGRGYSNSLGPFSCPYSPECVEKLSDKSQPRASLLTIRRLIAA